MNADFRVTIHRNFQKAQWLMAVMMALSIAAWCPSVALAGDVLVDIVVEEWGDTIIITGDDADNSFEVYFDTGATSLSINAGPGTNILGPNQDVGRQLYRVKINLGSGNDQIWIAGDGGFGQFDSIDINTGGGDDFVSMDNYFGPAVGELMINTGSGDDFVSLSLAALGNVMVDTQQGKDAVWFAGNIGGNLLVSTGTQLDEVALQSGAISGLAQFDGGKGGQDALRLLIDPQYLTYGSLSVIGFEDSDL